MSPSTSFATVARRPVQFERMGGGRARVESPHKHGRAYARLIARHKTVEPRAPQADCGTRGLQRAFDTRLPGSPGNPRMIPISAWAFHTDILKVAQRAPSNDAQSCADIPIEAHA